MTSDGIHAESPRPDSTASRSAARARHRAIALRLADNISADPGRPPNPYVARYLTAHAALGNAWKDLGDRPEVLDHLDPQAVMAHVLSSAFGRPDLPADVAAVVAGGSSLSGVPFEDRAGLRDLAVAMEQGYLRRDPGVPVPGQWRIRWARTHGRARNATLQLGFHPDSVLHSLCAVEVGDGRVLLAAADSESHSVQLWDPSTGSRIGEPLAANLDITPSLCAIPTASGTLLAVGGSGEHTISVWDPSTGERLRDLRGHSSWVRDMCTLRLGSGATVLATASEDLTVKIWDTESWSPRRSLAAAEILGVWSVSPFIDIDHRPYLVTGSVVGNLMLWDTDTWDVTTETGTQDDARAPVMCHVQLPDGAVVVAYAGGTGQVRLWDPIAGAFDNGPVLADMPRSVSAIYPPDGRSLLLFAGRSGSTCLWDPAADDVFTLEAGIRHEDDKAPITDTAQVVLADDRRIVATVTPSAIRLWDTLNFGPQRDRSTAHTSGVSAIVFAPDLTGRPTLVTAGGDHTVRMWHPESGLPVYRNGRPLVFVSNFGASRVQPIPGSAGWLAAGSRGSIQVFADTGESICTASVNEDAWDCEMAFSRDTCQLVVVANETVYVCDLSDLPETIEPPRTIELGEHVNAVITLNHENQHFAVVATGTAVRLWDLSDRSRPPLSLPLSRVSAMCVLADHLLVVGTDEGTVSVLDIGRPDPVVSQMQVPAEYHWGERIWALCPITLKGEHYIVGAAKERLYLWTVDGQVHKELPIDRHVTMLSSWNSLLAFATGHGHDLYVADLGQV